MNNEEIKLTEYLHNIIENNMSLRNENDRLWKQKLEYIERISKAIEYIGKYAEVYEANPIFDNFSIHASPKELINILKGEKE